jgi:hypothetical protein
MEGNEDRFAFLSIGRPEHTAQNLLVAAMDAVKRPYRHYRWFLVKALEIRQTM